jgi:hypothetical protein
MNETIRAPSTTLEEVNGGKNSREVGQELVWC